MDATLKNIDCIILAGGRGTRLKSLVSDVPKPMAPINGLPFLHYLIDELHRQGLERFTLATGYKSDIIQDYFEKHPPSCLLQYSVESRPLGTGGGLVKGLQKVTSKKVLVINGDTFFKFEAQAFLAQAQPLNVPCVIALKKVFNSNRYGSVRLSGNRILQFEEKTYKEEALINSGVYLLDRQAFMQKNFPQEFSFEKAYLEGAATQGELRGIPMEGYFIDIGVPEDYKKAQDDFKKFTH